MMNHVHNRTEEEVLQLFETSLFGLSDEEALNRQKKFGKNELPVKRKKHPFWGFAKQFNSVLVYALFAAAIFSFAVGHALDAYVILAITILNALLGFLEERKALRAISALSKEVVHFAKVYRRGEMRKIEARDLVPGDVIFIESGDKVPADARLIESKGIRTNEAVLTGESLPVDKSVGRVTEETVLGDQKNMLWMSTLVVSGEGKAVIACTGDKTEMGRLVESMIETETPESYFETQVKRLGLEMGAIALISACVIFVIGYVLRNLEFLDVFLFGIASLVSGIPEGLPAALTIILALGAERMAKKHAIVRHLPAVETLGVTTVIATDKTGTLTENSLVVERILTLEAGEVEVGGKGWEPSGTFSKKGEIFNPLSDPIVAKLLHISTVCNSARVLKSKEGYEVIGDPTEAALIVLSEKAGLNREAVYEAEKKLAELTFDQDHKYRAVLVAHPAPEIYVVGACENIIEYSKKVAGGEGVREMTKEVRSALKEESEHLADRGMRVLGIAYRPLETSGHELAHDDVRDLVYVGMVGMMDTPRSKTKGAIMRARGAGIRVVMITGDHPKTAVAIAREIGLVGADEDMNGSAITEQELLRLKPQEFESAIRKVKVCARITPTMKLKIVETLQAQGEIVAMTGDGVNDAPALKQANVGIAMGGIGTDAAREASHIILADDNFNSIVSAIEEGRVILANIRRTSFYLFTTNVAESVVIMASLLLALPLPLLPLHVLWLNIVTDGIAAMPLASERGHGGELRAKPRKKGRILDRGVVPFLLIVTACMTLGTIGLFLVYLPEGLQKAQTVAFSVMALFQIFNVLNMRSLGKSIFAINLLENKALIGGFLLSIVLQFGVVSLSLGRSAFSLASLTPKDWLIITLVSSSVIWGSELYKALRTKPNAT